tara:strand:- start:140 stop:493 length:354 start_codon:yes stop_codon:yes gene_type:complete
VEQEIPLQVLARKVIQVEQVDKVLQAVIWVAVAEVMDAQVQINLARHTVEMVLLSHVQCLAELDQLMESLDQIQEDILPVVAVVLHIMEETLVMVELAEVATQKAVQLDQPPQRLMV